jgi:hypothetical protein
MEHHLVQQRRLGIQCFNTLQSKHEREDKNCAMDQALLHKTIELILWSTTTTSLCEPHLLYCCVHVYTVTVYTGTVGRTQLARISVHVCKPCVPYM